MHREERIAVEAPGTPTSEVDLSPQKSEGGAAKEVGGKPDPTYIVMATKGEADSGRKERSMVTCVECCREAKVNHREVTFGIKVVGSLW